MEIYCQIQARYKQIPENKLASFPTLLYEMFSLEDHTPAEQPSYASLRCRKPPVQVNANLSFPREVSIQNHHYGYDESHEDKFLQQS